ncbi:hypothetical protein KIN20_027710 [Parelaphostrongylus tenuis]|uniref:Uncharacterized protein n=1 Tax=Parelaphostrongylus tenuis TaxID=148309 RepID=A0AAD5QZY2_PARTN|nr:hypothetical protein KIN20_027710 [Parelaphostrongylus tenuis]
MKVNSDNDKMTTVTSWKEFFVGRLLSFQSFSLITSIGKIVRKILIPKNIIVSRKTALHILDGRNAIGKREKIEIGKLK